MREKRVYYHKMARTISNSKATYIAKRQMMTYAMVIFYLTNHTGTVVQKCPCKYFQKLKYARKILFGKKFFDLRIYFNQHHT